MRKLLYRRIWRQAFRIKDDYSLMDRNEVLFYFAYNQVCRDFGKKKIYPKHNK